MTYGMVEIGFQRENVSLVGEFVVDWVQGLHGCDTEEETQVSDEISNSVDQKGSVENTQRRNTAIVGSP